MDCKDRSQAVYGFDLSCLSNKDAAGVQTFNASLGRLAEQRVKEISVDGHLLKSKLAWKVATYRQSVLYRIVMLASGCALNWNMKNALCSFLAARALMETVVLVLDFEHKLNKYLKDSNLAAIDLLVMQHTFATRDAEWIKEYPDSAATSILTYIDRIDKRLLPGIRRHYDFLSERCHPNSLGHHAFFATLDTATGTTTYNENKNPKINFDHILGGALLIEIAENCLTRMDTEILQLAELQYSINPIDENS